MRSLILAAIVLTATPAMAQTRHASLMPGNWYGVGLQVGPDGIQSSWDIALSINPDFSGAIAYPTLGCKGVLTRVTSTSSQIELIEKITEGDCIDGGRMTAVLQNGRLFWRWTKRGGDIEASAVLHQSQLIG